MYKTHLRVFAQLRQPVANLVSQQQVLKLTVPIRLACHAVIGVVGAQQGQYRVDVVKDGGRVGLHLRAIAQWGGTRWLQATTTRIHEAQAACARRFTSQRKQAGMRAQRRHVNLELARCI